MIYYSLRDILKAYKISKSTLKSKMDKGLLIYEQLPTCRDGTKPFKIIIPETELVKLEYCKVRVPIASDDAQPDYYKARYRAHDAVDTVWVEHLKCEAGEAQKKKSYYEYILSEEWQKLRRKRLQLDGYVCRECGTGKNLQVHHITYRHLRQPEEINDLVSLCRTCHERVHAKDLSGG